MTQPGPVCTLFALAIARKAALASAVVTASALGRLVVRTRASRSTQRHLALCGRG